MQGGIGVGLLQAFARWPLPRVRKPASPRLVWPANKWYTTWGPSTAATAFGCPSAQPAHRVAVDGSLQLLHGTRRQLHRWAPVHEYR